MPYPSRRTLPRWGSLMLLAAVVAAGCGDSGGGGTSPAPAPPAARGEEFPPGAGKTLDELRAGMPQGPSLAPSVSALETGKNRFGFALFDRARKQISGAEVAIYTAEADRSGVRGPFPARRESLATKPRFTARTTSQDPDAAKIVYVADVPFRKDGKQVVFALARLDGRLVASSPAPVEVGLDGGPPDVGEKAIKVSTPTEADVGGDLSKIDTRVPPSTQHEVDFADVLGKQPVVLTFATPQLCRSRVCGPVVDVAEQLKAQYGKEVAFIHMEIFENNELTNPPRFREQVLKWRLPSEPWTFVIGKDGRVKARFEGAFSVDELRRAIERVV